MILCNISVGREGNEWIAVISYENGKVTELRDAVFEEVMHAIASELEGLE